MLEQEIQSKVDSWLTGNYDQPTKNGIQKLIDAGDETALIDSFYKNLEFGTGGLRGLMGVGSNRMNKYTVGMATQGLANYLKKVYPDEQIKAVIACDSRNNSDYFSQITADVLSANGIEVYKFKELRPTPLLSFAVRHFEAHTGVVITASHNPKEYNGYKAYWKGGAQVIPPHDKNIITEVDKITSPDQVKFEADASKIVEVGEEVDQLYIEKILSLSISQDAIKNQKNLSIVFTPIHGTGITLAPQLLKAFGFENVTVVDEQSTPDGNFPTVVYPNPEEAEALKIALDKAKDIDADLLLGTDPDSDRVGIAIKDPSGDFKLLNGNQTGCLLFYYLLNAWKKAGKIDGKQYICKTIVTSDIMHAVAKGYGVECFDVLTGFKYIADLIAQNEGEKTFICGGEESYGYLVGEDVRDKDAISACAFIAEMAAFAKDNGQNLFDFLIEMYLEYGFYKEHLISITKKGKTGAEEIAKMMEDMRVSPPKSIVGEQLLYKIDYKSGIKENLITGEQTETDLPSSNVLQFISETGTKFTARPSGTEPKIKFYFSVNAPLNSKEEYEAVDTELNTKIQKMVLELGLE